MKTIEQLLLLSRNPHYQMSQEELKQLEEYRRQENGERQNKNEFNKHDTSFQRHDVRIKTTEE